MRFQIHRGGTGEYRWRLTADDGRAIAESSEGYEGRAECERAIQLVREASGAPIEDLTAAAVPGEGRGLAGGGDLDHALETAFKQGEG